MRSKVYKPFKLLLSQFLEKKVQQNWGKTSIRNVQSWFSIFHFYVFRNKTHSWQLNIFYLFLPQSRLLFQAPPQFWVSLFLVNGQMDEDVVFGGERCSCVILNPTFVIQVQNNVHVNCPGTNYVEKAMVLGKKKKKIL